ncbi:MAG: MBL fold metallo-hydrolase [candidate division Zixibacteria bacterium]|nr:MBL fold metallo-hydrolase [candidate division Zixibacteria bacterium]
MPLPLRITTVVDNTAWGRGLLGEHGLAYWVEAGDHRILFDTGQGLAIAHNVEELDIPLPEADAIVLSHGHYDHSGGLPYALKHARKARLYFHAGALAPRYAEKGRPRYTSGMAPEMSQVFERYRPVTVHTSQPTEIFHGVWVSGEIPRKFEAEDYHVPFFTDEALTRPDTIVDDQALVIDAEPGLVVLLGCAHAGVINTLTYVTEFMQRSDIYAVLGGMHLISADREQLEVTAEHLEGFGIQMLVPMHCTGAEAIAYLRSRFPRECVTGYTGSVFSF